MLKEILAEIDLDTLESFKFKYRNNEVQISLIGTVQILNSLGDWKDFVALNINTMIKIMDKDALDTMDMSMCFPCNGYGWNINVDIVRIPVMVEVATDALVEINSVVDNKTVSRRGRKAKSDV